MTRRLPDLRRICIIVAVAVGVAGVLQLRQAGETELLQ